MSDQETLRIRHRDSGVEADLVRFDPKVKDRILVRRDGEVVSEFVLDWEPVEGHRQVMYEWLSEQEDKRSGTFSG